MSDSVGSRDIIDRLRNARSTGIDHRGEVRVPLAVAVAAVHAAADLGSPDERLREALRDANEYLAQIADYSPSEVADAIDSVRAQIKDALAATDSRGKPDGASVPDQSCATSVRSHGSGKPVYRSLIFAGSATEHAA